MLILNSNNPSEWGILVVTYLTSYSRSLISEELFSAQSTAEQSSSSSPYVKIQHIAVSII